MKYIITEEQYKRIIKSGPALDKAIISYMEKLLNGAKRRVTPKSRNYGNLREDWCKDGKEIMSVHYYFGEPNGEDDIINNDFYNGQIFISQNIIDTIKKLVNVREKYVLNVIAEWYDDEYVQAFATEMDEPYLHIDDAEPLDKEYPCADEITVSEDISDEEMIEFIVKNTLYRENEVINMINTGTDLKEFYLEILEIQDRHKRMGI